MSFLSQIEQILQLNTQLAAGKKWHGNFSANMIFFSSPFFWAPDKRLSFSFLSPSFFFLFPWSGRPTTSSGCSEWHLDITGVIKAEFVLCITINITFSVFSRMDASNEELSQASKCSAVSPWHKQCLAFKGSLETGSRQYGIYKKKKKEKKSAIPYEIVAVIHT